MVDFAFHILWDFHRPILGPVHEALKERYKCLFTTSHEEIIASRPKVLVLADGHHFYFRPHIPGSVIVYIRHGFSHKNFLAKNIAGADVVCVSSDYVRQELTAKAWLPRYEIWATGFQLMDDAFIRPQTRVAGSVRLLYAPTYNPGLNSCELIGENGLVELVKAIPELEITIKPHPVLPERTPKWVEWWRANIRQTDKIRLIEDSHSSIYKLFPDTDILLSDASSVMFYFLAMNRPVISLVNKERPVGDLCYDPNGPEFAWRDFLNEVHDMAELQAILTKIVATGNDGLEGERLKYQHRVFGDNLNPLSSNKTTAMLEELLHYKQPQYAASNLKLAEYERCITQLNGTLQATKDQVDEVTHARNLISEQYHTEIARANLQIQTLKDDQQELGRKLVECKAVRQLFETSLPIRLSAKLNRVPLIKSTLRRIAGRVLNE